MMDPFVVFVVAALATVGVTALCFRKWYTTVLSGYLTAAILLSISYGSGWPTNAPFPDHAIIYGLTSDHVWAGTKDQPLPPRSYKFQVPPEWFEERDRVHGQPFEVERQGEEQMEGSESDRLYDNESGWRVVPSTLPPKE